eukprot:365758-Chlamydomonas_euryale.AAC.10
MDGEREGRRARQREGRRDEGVHGTSGGRDEGIARGEARRSPTLARVPHLHEVPENQRDCTLAALELIGDCHLAAQHACAAKAVDTLCACAQGHVLAQSGTTRQAGPHAWPPAARTLGLPPASRNR